MRTVTWNKYHDYKNMGGGIGVFKMTIDILHARPIYPFVKNISCISKTVTMSS